MPHRDMFGIGKFFFGRCIWNRYTDRGIGVIPWEVLAVDFQGELNDGPSADKLPQFLVLYLRYIHQGYAEGYLLGLGAASWASILPGRVTTAISVFITKRVSPADEVRALAARLIS